jgi:exopolysaccharide biosynthesis polyprenyl glycosylphosphotransferase
MQVVHGTDTSTGPASDGAAGTTARPATRNPKAWLVIADGCTVSLSMLLSFWLRGTFGPDLYTGAGADHLLVGLVALPVWLMLFARGRLYNARFIDRRTDEIRRIASATTTVVLVMMAISYALGLPVSRLWLALTFVFAVTLMSAEREIVRRTFRTLRTSGRLQRSVVIVGSNDEAVALGALLDRDTTLGYQVVGFVNDDEDLADGTLGPVGETLDLVRRTGAHSVIISASATSVETSNVLVRELIRRGIHVELSSTLRDIAAHRLTVRPLGRFPVVYIEPCQSGGWRAFAKRSFDLTASLVALLVIAPLAAAVAVAVKLDSSGPVLFRQKRVGRDGKIFEIQKFRTMIQGAEDLVVELREQNEADGPLFKLKADPRTTRIGRFLRRTSLDELPQLMNVVKGEMSLVGPRPALPEEVMAWPAPLHDRLRVQPGITGMWQVSGRSNSSFEDYSRLDRYYVDNWSLVTDVIIIIKTIPVVLFGRGAY